MILVDNTPVLTLDKSDPRRDWFETEMAKIKAKKDPVVIKRKSGFRINSNGRRTQPPLQSIQSYRPIERDGNIENWACCQTYKKKQDGTLSLDPDFYRFKLNHVFYPQKDAEIIFFVTRILNINKYGFVIDNPEEDARKKNEEEMGELEVRYAIYKTLQDINDLRFHAKAWGIINADKMQPEQLRRTLFETIKKSEENIQSTKKGYKEFLDEVLNITEEITEARMIVNLALNQSILDVNKTTRRVTYTPSGETVFIVPLDHKDRIPDYIADGLLRKRKDLLETLRMDTTGVQPDFHISEADLEGITTIEALREVAKKLGVPLHPALKDETKIRDKIREKIKE